MERKRILLPSNSSLIIILTPLLLMCLPIFVPGQQSLCGYLILVIAVYWISDCISLSATGMLPMILFGLFGMLSLPEITKSYFFSGIWLVIGSLMLATAVQTSKLHERIALKILLTVGTEPRRLLIGFMMTAHFLSMFIANLAVLAMLLPIADGVLKQIKEQVATSRLLKSNTQKTNEVEDQSHEITSSSKEQANNVDVPGSNNIKEEFSVLLEDKEQTNTLEDLQKAIVLSIPYGCTIGGVSTLTGSAANIIANDILQLAFPESEKISFVTWFLVCAPGSLLITVLACTWMIWLYFGFRDKAKDTVDKELVRQLLQKEYDQLGKINWEQVWVIFLLVTTTVLWFTRNPGFIPGWGQLFPKGYVTDGTVAMAMGFMVFIIPKKIPKFFGDEEVGRKCQPKILTYKEFQSNFPWDIIFIGGGGLCISAAAQASGLSTSIAQQIDFLSELPAFVVCLLVTSVACFLTEATSAMAISSIFIPVLGQIALKMRIHPYYFCLPLYLSSMQSFMLPIANPINAITYTKGYFKTKDMIKAGWMLNIIGILVTNLNINTLGRIVLDLNHLPEWADPGNNTLAAPFV